MCGNNSLSQKYMFERHILQYSTCLPSFECSNEEISLMVKSSNERGCKSYLLTFQDRYRFLSEITKCTYKVLSTMDIKLGKDYI